MRSCFGPATVIFRAFGVVLLSSVLTPILTAQLYRTFSQEDLAGKNARIRVQVRTITIENVTADTMDGVGIQFATPVLMLRDSGGFQNISILGRSRILDARGPIPPGRIIRFVYDHYTRDKSRPLGGILTHPNISGIWFTKNDQRFAEISYSEGNEGYLLTAGNVRDDMYRRVIPRGKGLLMGATDAHPLIGSIRYLKSDRRHFPHTGPPRCFSFIRAFKNPKVTKHDNHLLGELHALKLAIIGNDSAFIAPWHDVRSGLRIAPLFGDLLYNDTGSTADPANGRTIRQIAQLGDSALSFCSNYSTTFYTALDRSISRINSAFRGELRSQAVDGRFILGARDVTEVDFLRIPTEWQSDPGNVPRRDEEGAIPAGFGLAQNYPNPFNPATVITYILPVDGTVTLKVYSAAGQEVVTLLENEFCEKGHHEVEFDATDLASGVYYYRIFYDQSPNTGGERFTRTGRMLLLK